MAEVARPLRFLNLVLAAGLVVTPWVLGGGTVAGGLSDTLVALVVAGLSLPRGRRSQEHYGSWDRFII